MSKDASKPEPENPGRQQTRIRAFHAGQEFDAAQEAELWQKLGKGKAAVEALTIAKSTRVHGVLKNVDSTPLTPEEFVGITQQAIRHAVEQPRVCEVHGANLAAAVHETLCGYVADPQGEISRRTEKAVGDPAQWFRSRLPLEHFEEALKDATDGEAELWQAIQDFNVATKKLLQQYERLARQLARAKQGLGLALEDLTCVARTALWKALRLFRPEEGNQFSTYATTAIKNEIASAFREAAGVGTYLPRRAAEFSAEREVLVAKLEREVSDAEVYESLGWSELERSRFAKGKPLLSPERLDTGSANERETNPVGGEKKPLDELIVREERLQVLSLLKQLDETSQRVIQLRYFATKPMSQRAVGTELGLTREQVRGLEEGAIASLRRMLEELDRPKSPVEKS